MKIQRLDFYLDGGTVAVTTEAGTYFVDRRIETNTWCAIYDKYPNNTGAMVVNPDTAALLWSELRSNSIPGYERAIETLLSDKNKGI